jgi:dipeptidyl aminopeptidase/acylaminoacyl peptidase
MERPSLPRDPLTLSAGIVPMRPDQISRNPTLNPWLLACLLGGALTPAVDAAAPAARPPATKPAAKAAAPMAPAAYLAALPTLIDRDLFFGDAEITAPQLSPDGAFIAFLKPWNGTRNVWVKRTEEPIDKARPVTADARRPVLNYFWGGGGKFLLWVRDRDADDGVNLYAVDPAAAAAAGADVPAPRNLTDLKGVRAVFYHVPPTDPDAVYVGLNDRDQAWPDLYKVKLSTGERTLLRRNTDRIVGWHFDLKDALRLATRGGENGDQEVLRVDEAGVRRIASCGIFETCEPVRFHKDGRRVYVMTNHGPGLDRVQLSLVDVASGQEERVESDPENKVDLAGPIFSDVTQELIATRYVDDKPRWYWRDESFAAVYEDLVQKLPGREISLLSSTQDERLYLVSARGDVEPGETYLFDRASGTLTLQYRLREALPRTALSEMKAIRYASSDGLEIPAFLTMPKGAPAKGLPLVVVPHGGPWARDMWGYSGLVQFLANRGYAVLQPNFRGSTGFGRKFLDAGNLQWGDRMQDDITWGVKSLVTEGVVDPKRVAILGVSYGGYATLAGLAFTPDVYAAGVSIVGPSSLTTLLESIPPFWEFGRKTFSVRMGDPATPEGKARLARQSPLGAAAKIRAPLLVVQGGSDPRAKKSESDQVVFALRRRGVPVEYLVAPDEGHGFQRPVNTMAAYAAAEAFLARHLGGRAERHLTPEVAARLKEITVDPKTVEPPPRLAAWPAPKPARPLEPGTLRYKSRMERDGHSMEAAVASVVEDGGDGWVVTDTMQSPVGVTTDRAVLSRDTLALRSRTLSRGEASVVRLDVKNGKIVGESRMSGAPRSIDVAFAGDLFADGPGAARLLATLPLGAGYTATYRNFDLSRHQVKPMELKVTGSETVTVPAGTFEAFTVEVASPDDGAKITFWVAKAAAKVVKSVAVVPQSGATLTTELQ